MNTKEKLRRLADIKLMMSAIAKRKVNADVKQKKLDKERLKILKSISKTDRELYAEDIAKYENPG